MRRYTLPAFAVLLLVVSSTLSQNTDYREELRFAEALRNRGDNDLALEVIQRLRKTAPPDLVKELSLEEAKTRLRVAGDEPETARRLRQYREAREDFQKFIDANPNHPRVAEANRDIARLLNLTGRTELNQALLAEDNKSKNDLARQARGTLEQAAEKLKAAEDALKVEKEKLPDPAGLDDPAKKKEAAAAIARMERELKETGIERGLNLYDQSSTYISGGDEAASKLLVAAKKILDEFTSGPPTDPAKWKAMAWQGRIVHQIDSAAKAGAVFAEVLRGAETPANTEGVRLARYFNLLVLREQPPPEMQKTPGALPKQIITSATAWRARYPKHRKTSEGCGITFLLAQTLLAEADRVKAFEKDYRARAQNLLRELESSENEYTDRARRLKIQAIARQGKFAIPVEKLTTFEDCYIRAQYEAFQLNQDAVEDLRAQLKRLPDPATVKDNAEKKKVNDARVRIEAEIKKLDDPKEQEKKRARHIDNIIKVLTRGLAMPEVAKMKANRELDSARAMIAYWALNTGKLEDAIKHAEQFARESPRSSQAGISAVYAVQGYTQLLANKQGADDEADLRARLMSLAQYMEERWPGELAGEIATHTIALQMLKEDNVREAIKKLSLISPGYANYSLTRYQLAHAAIKAENEKLEPIDGDRPGDYRKRAMLALESMPVAALGADPTTNLLTITGKSMLGRDLFRYKRFAQMDKLAADLLGRLAGLKFSDDEAKDTANRNQLRFELVDIQLYARYGLASAAFESGEFAKVSELLDPLIDRVAKADDSQEKINLQKNPQLATGLLTTALKANLQLGKIDRTEVALDALDKLNADGDASGTTNILRLVAFLIRNQVEELRAKNDKEGLARAIKGYTALLDKRIKKQGEMKSDFIRVLADCYSSMGEHAKAATELGKVADPRAKAGTDEDKQFKAVQILRIRELRLSKDRASLKQARELMESIRGDDKKPSWGRQNINAVMEHGMLLGAEEKWEEGFRLWAGLVKQLVKAAPKGGHPKEFYLECYYHMVFCYLKSAQAKAAKSDRDKGIAEAARQIVNFESSWEDFGSEASKARFTELLKAEPALREQYETLKKK